MAQFNSLLVTGESRFINPINGNARNGVYTVIGTQTASTSAWTGKIDVPALYDGLRIAYYLPYASTSTAVTLNLTLSTGTTTGAINCYYGSTGRLTEQYPVGDTIILSYYSAGAISVSGTATTDNRWVAETSIDENVKQSSSGWSANDYPLLFSNSSGAGTITSSVYKSLQLTYDPSNNEIVFKNSSASTGNSPSFRIRDYDSTNAAHDYVELGKYTTFRAGVQVWFEQANVDFDSDTFVSLAGDLNLLDGTGTITGEGNIDIDGDITCTGALSADTLNGKTIGNSPKFTDTIGQIYYCETDSTSTTSAFVVTISGITALTDGLTICVKNTVGTSVSGCTLNLNGLGAKTIWLSLDNAACTTEWKNNSIYIFVYDATNQRWIMNMGRDTDVTGNNIVARYSRLPSGGNNVKKYSLFAMLPSGVYSSFTTNSGTGSKTFDSTNYFDIRKIYAYGGSSDRSTGDLLSASGWKLQGYDIDMRYSFNGVTTKASTSSLVLDKPVYLVFDPSAGSGGCYKIKSPYYTQTPTSTGCIYVLVGVMRDSYRLDFWFYNPAFTYDGTKLVPFPEAPYQPTYSITKSSGNWSVDSINAYRAGSVVHMHVVFKGNGSSVSGGSNGFTGTLSGALPACATTFNGYWDNSVLSMRINTNGSIIVRTSASITIGSSETTDLTGTFITKS